MKIIAAPNAFKGSLTATEAALAMETGIKKVLPNAEIIRVPVADGGDGLVEVAKEALNGEIRSQQVTGPGHKPVQADYCYIESMDLLTVEMALASGLALLPPDQQDPTRTTTYGTGELIKTGLDLGVKTINVGIGGSATNDGGMGMAQALGVRFLDKNDQELPGIGAALTDIARIDISGLDPRLKSTKIAAVCDVDNPLCGTQGAAHVYGPQKGADPQQVKELDKGLENLARLIQRDLGVDVLTMPGGGAAGGLGAGLYAFLNARLCRGIDLIFELVNLEEKMTGADLVLTGEGQIDFQTVFGKAPGGVGALAQKMNIPCIAIAGSIGEDLGSLHQDGISAVFSLCSGPISLEQAIQEGAANISRVTEQVIRCFLLQHH